MKKAHHSAVDVVIVNWNGGAQIETCVRSLIATEPEELASVTVVDNASHDGSDRLVEQIAGVTVLRTGANVGFGRACNAGAACGAAPFILLLNPDTRLDEAAIAPARAFLESDTGQGYAVCGIRHVDEGGAVARHCARFPTAGTFVGEMLGLSRLAPRLFPPLHLKEFDHLTSRPVDHVMAAFALMRRDAFDAVGGFDPDYFVYLEDLDLSRRLAMAGSPTFYLADASVLHRGGGTSRAIKTRALYYVLDARLVYARHHFGKVGRGLVSALTVLADPITRSFFQLAKGQWRDVPSIWSAHAMLWLRLIRGRHRV